MANSNGNLKNSGQNACSYFIPFLTGNVSVKLSAIQALLHVLFKYILINETSFTCMYSHLFSCI